MAASTMRVTEVNDVKIYNLSAGQSLPDWLADREKAKKKSREHTRRSIRLLQDFGMPVVSTKLAISRDQRFVAAIGTYKPRIRCYEVDQLSMKFERCFDSEVAAFTMLSDDYSKIAFLHVDRYVELHAQFGRYYRLRIPTFGRDIAYHRENCDLYFASDGPNIHRLNLEQGRFLASFAGNTPSSNVCAINNEHQLIIVGGTDGIVEAWDPRSRQRVGKLDCIRSLLEENCDLDGSGIEITALTFRDGLNLAVGSSKGFVQLFDLRASSPLLIKDHQYGLPVKKIAFHGMHDHVMSMDARGVKIWDRLTGEPFAAVESEAELNDLAVYPNSGLLMMANEEPCMQIHFIPALGPAPSWCSFLDSLTEEMEESTVSEVYDDYKFVTKGQLVDLGLEHLIGTSLLRAYSHGFFMDIRLYRKAEAVRTSSKFPNLAASKVRKSMNEARKSRVVPTSSIPSVNKDLYLKLKGREEDPRRKKAKQKSSEGLLQDDRFADLFKDERFAVDPNEEAFKLINPVLSKLDESRMKELEARLNQGNDGSESDEESDTIQATLLSSSSSDSDELSGDSDEADVANKERRKRSNVLRNHPMQVSGTAEKVFEMTEGLDDSRKKRAKVDKLSLEDRLAAKEDQSSGGSKLLMKSGTHEMIFKERESLQQIERKLKEKAHRTERQQLRRTTGKLKNKRKSYNL